MRDHVQQHRFAHARAGHDADALADAKRGQRIQRAHADIEGLAHGRAVQRAGADAANGPQGLRMDRAEAVDRVPLAVDCAAQIARADVQHPRRALGPHAGAGAQQHRVAQQHRQRTAIAKTDDLGGQRALRVLVAGMASAREDVAGVVILGNAAQGAHRHLQPGHLQQAAIAGGHQAIGARRQIDAMRHSGRRRGQHGGGAHAAAPASAG